MTKLSGNAHPSVFLLFSTDTETPITPFRDQRTNLKPTTTVLDTGADPNLINLRFLPEAWRHRIQSANIGSLVMAARQRISVTGVIPLYIQLGDLHFTTCFSVIDKLATDVLLGTSFINRYIESVFPP